MSLAHNAITVDVCQQSNLIYVGIVVVSVFQPLDAQTLADIAVSLRAILRRVSHTECMHSP